MVSVPEMLSFVAKLLEGADADPGELADVFCMGGLTRTEAEGLGATVIRQRRMAWSIGQIQTQLRAAFAWRDGYRPPRLPVTVVIPLIRPVPPVRPVTIPVVPAIRSVAMPVMPKVVSAPKTRPPRRRGPSHRCPAMAASGEQCRQGVIEAGERYCLWHRTAGSRRRARAEAKRRADSLARLKEEQAALATHRQHLPWRQWRPLTEADCWAQTPAIETDPPLRPSRETAAADREYREGIALYQRTAALNWPHGRIRPSVRAWRAEVPGRDPGWRARPWRGSTARTEIRV